MHIVGIVVLAASLGGCASQPQWGSTENIDLTCRDWVSQKQELYGKPMTYEQCRRHFIEMSETFKR